MDHMLPSPGFSIPSIGTPMHQPEQDELPSSHTLQNLNSSSTPHSLMQTQNVVCLLVLIFI